MNRQTEVREYLSRHGDMVDFVYLVREMVSKRFGTQAELSLKVYHDPEFEDEYLVLYVRQEHYDQDFLDKIESLRDEYQEELAGKSGWFLVTTDFHSPELITTGTTVTYEP